MSDTIPADELKMAAEDLYREEIYTDRRVGTIRRLVPVTPEGAVDPARREVFLGQAQLLTPYGALPISFEIPADDLKTAVERFPEAAQQGVEKTLEELREMQREAASSIVVPGQGGAGGLGGGGMPGGGLGGGGMSGGGMPGGGIPGGGLQIP